MIDSITISSKVSHLQGIAPAELFLLYHFGLLVHEIRDFRILMRDSKLIIITGGGTLTLNGSSSIPTPGSELDLISVNIQAVTPDPRHV